MVVVTLPVGVPHLDAELRPPTGEDEAWLLEAGGSLLPVRRTTLLLHRCLLRLGPLAPVPLEAVRDLPVGDREALLLHLRRLTLGEAMPCVLRCPDPGCGERMDLDLRVSDLLISPTASGQEHHEVVLDGRKIRFRLPTGGDQEEAAELAGIDPDAAADLLLRRCVGEPPDDLPPFVAERLPGLMAELDPQAELTLDLTCPACGHGFSTIFDAGSHLFQELRNQELRLYREVHLLAFHYHWSEREILELPGRKRRLYLDLLSEALGEGGPG
jgi:hypothetical protein